MVPFSFLEVSILTSNLLIFLTIAISHPIEFSNLYLSKFSFQLELIFLFSNAPLHPLLLSYSSKPFLKDCVASV